MKRPIQTFFLPAFSLCAGLAALGLRLWLYSDIDPNGLLPAGHPAHTVLFVLTGLVMALLLLCKPQKPIRLTFPAEALGAFAASAGLLIADVLLPLSQDSISLWLLPPVIAAVSFAALGVFRLKGKRAPLIFPTLSTVYMMLWPVLQYRTWSADPQLQDYFFHVLAAVFLMLYGYRFTLAEGGENQDRALHFLANGCVFLCLACLPCERWPFYVGAAVWCLSGSFRKVPAMELPRDVLLCIRTLEDAGHATYAVGGCVRDALMGNPPHDYDLCTSATPEEICDIFGSRTLVHSGEKHGTVGVVIRKQVYEITTFRTEGGYTDNRHPDWVKFVTTIEEDLARRDFTVNAMAYSPRAGYIDPFGGQEDLENGILRCVGDPEERFKEDSLRILRGMRFAARLGFRLEGKTERAMRELAPLMDSLARERVFDELCKFLPVATAANLQRFAPILTQVIPELKASIDFDQHNPYHAYDVFTHTAHVVEAVPAVLALRWAALLHDVAKPQTFTLDDIGIGHFLGHAVESAHTADHILRRLKAPTALREQVVFLIEHHMHTLEADRKLLRRRISRCGEENIRLLLALQQADFSSKGTGTPAQAPAFDQVQSMLEQILAENACLTVKDLAVTGSDLMALDFAPGPRLGDCLNWLLSLVLDETIPNEKDTLLQKAKEFLER